MGTTASALSAASTASADSSSLLPGVASFNGTSQYASDLQQAINQAVTVASIPLTELEDNVTTLQGQSTEVTTLQNDFSAIQTAVESIATSSGNGALSATVSDQTVASASVDSSAALAGGTYTLNVISDGSPELVISNSNLPTVSDPTASSISSSSSYTLTVGNSTYQVSPSANTLDALAEAINSAGAGVNATVVNVGSAAAPSYQLALQGTALGSETIQLNDGSQNLLSELSAGSEAQYQVDGEPSTPISSDSSTVTIAPGVTADLLGTGLTTITVAPDASAAANALSSFATAYNSALAELNNNHGTSGGALTGQEIVTQLSQSLQSLIGYTGGSGNVQSLADVGLTFNSSGQLEFDQSTFENVASTDAAGVEAFLGSPTTGGFLENATNVLNGLQDTNTGIFTTTTNSLSNQITSDNTEITDTETRITTMQNNLTAQMTQADTLIASLESQDSYFTTLFQDEQNDLTNSGS